MGDLIDKIALITGTASRADVTTVMFCKMRVKADLQTCGSWGRSCVFSGNFGLSPTYEGNPDTASAM